MLKTILNLDILHSKMKELGFNQTSIANKLNVSRESVSQWFSGDNFPRALHLLKLGEILNLSYPELVIETTDHFEPIFAFSAAHNYEHTEEDKQKVVEIGYALEKLIPYLPKVVFKNTLANPKNETSYISQIVSDLKNRYNIPHIVRMADLMRIFNDYNAYLVPVLWDSKNNKSNGFHINLPESNTDWIYINLDSFIYDFKFWVIHELAHLLSPEFQPVDEAEDFANSFAAEFLFPIREAKTLYESITDWNLDNVKTCLFDKAIGLLISPYTIYKQLNKYLKSIERPTFEIPEVVDSFKNYIKDSHKISVTQYFFEKDSPSAKEYLDNMESEFNSSLLNALWSYYSKEGFSIGYIKNIFHISLQDAQNIYDEIIARNVKNSDINS